MHETPRRNHNTLLRSLTAIVAVGSFAVNANSAPTAVAQEKPTQRSSQSDAIHLPFLWFPGLFKNLGNNEPKEAPPTTTTTEPTLPPPTTTTEPPAPVPTTTTTEAPPTTSPEFIPSVIPGSDSSDAFTPAWWRCVITPESSGNFSDTSGGYGILVSTWNKYGMSGVPGEYPPLVQAEVVLQIYADNYGFGPPAWNNSANCGKNG